MTVKKGLIFLTFGTAVLFVISCSKELSPVEGRLKGDNYENAFFRFRMRIPQGWAVGDNALYQLGLARSKGISEASSDASKAANTNLLLLIYREPQSTKEKAAPCLIVQFDDLRRYRSIRTAKDYQLSTLEGLKLGKHPRKNVSGPMLTRLGGSDYCRMDMVAEVGGGDELAHQTYLARIEGDFCPVMAITAASENEANEILRQVGLLP